MEEKKSILKVLIISIALLGCGDNTTEITTTTGSDIEATTTGSVDDATVDGVDVAAPKDTSADTQECAPECTDRNCGDDGCGSSCGECGEGAVCNDAGQCECVPQCDGKLCGPNGCRGQCGSCAESEFCNDGQCETSCVSDKDCTQADQTQCNNDKSGVQNCVEAAPACFKWQDGDACPENQSCKDGKCGCLPQCDGKTCGNNGCGGNCGECAGGQECIDNNCQCVEKQSLKCFILSSKGDSAVHWADSCGNQGELSETCADSNACTVNGCSDGKCTVEPIADGTQCDTGKECTAGVCQCAPKSYVWCFKNSEVGVGQSAGKYWVDSCGNKGELIESCQDDNPCTTGECLPQQECYQQAKKEGTFCGEASICVGVISSSAKCKTCDELSCAECGKFASILKDCDCEYEVIAGTVCSTTGGLSETPVVQNVDSCGAKKGIVDVCDDKNPCTDDSCVADETGASCLFTNKSAGTSCQFNSSCVDGLCISCGTQCYDTESNEPHCGAYNGCDCSKVTPPVICIDGKQCIDNLCTCLPLVSDKCVENSVYWVDSCGNQGDLKKSCAPGEMCVNSQCVCVPQCDDNNCGADGCGGLCECQESETCMNTGQCTSDPTHCGAVYSTSKGDPTIFSKSKGVAIVRQDGSVLTSGKNISPGSKAKFLTSGTKTVATNEVAFAALKQDGSVVTWGDKEYGGNSAKVACGLKTGVTAIYSTAGAFAALKDNGSVITWGHKDFGGDSSAVSTQLSSGVETIYSGSRLFVAVKQDGSLIIWGYSPFTDFYSAAAEQIQTSVKAVAFSGGCHAVLMADGSVLAWGPHSCGGDYTTGSTWSVIKFSSVATQLSSGVKAIYGGSAFAALKQDGSVITWGNKDYGDSSAVADQLKNGVKAIYPKDLAFAALKDNGSVITWGHSDYGGDSSAVSTQLSSGVETIHSTTYAFAALKKDGSVITWGDPNSGGGGFFTSGVETIYSATYAFAALKKDGSVITWGSSDDGGDKSTVAAELSSGVKTIFPFGYGFAALKGDGSIYFWGNTSFGAATSYNGKSLCVLCGNNIIEGAELCDDGNTANGDQCSSDCACQSNGLDADCLCGNGQVDPGEECDDHNQVTEDCCYGEIDCQVCNGLCQSVAGKSSYCGDGITDKDIVETCDNGNTEDGDWCPDTCECVLPAPKTLFVATGIKLRRYDISKVDSFGEKAGLTPNLNATDMAFNHKTNELFWVVGYDNVIRKSFGGGNTLTPTEVLTDDEPISALDLDLSTDRIYWIRKNLDNKDAIPLVLRANLDGTNVETVLVSDGTALTANAQGLAIDVPHQMLYYLSASPNGHVMQVPLDGGQAKSIAETKGTATSIVVNPWGGPQVIWIEQNPVNQLMEADLSGGNVKLTKLSSTTPVTAIALDLTRGLMYTAASGKLYQSNISGGSSKILLYGFSGIAMAIDGNLPYGKACPWIVEIEKTCEDLCAEVSCTNLPNCDCGYKAQASFACMDNGAGTHHLYWLDSCGKKGDIKESCNGSGACTLGGCKDNSCFVENIPAGTSCGNGKVCMVTDPQTNTLSCKDACEDHISLLGTGQVGCCDHNTGLLKSAGTPCGKIGYYKEVKCVDNLPYIAKVSKTCTGKFCDDESSCKGTQAKCDGPIETENLNWVAQEPCPAENPICTPVNTDGKGYTCVQCTSDECCINGDISPTGYFCKTAFTTPSLFTYSCGADGIWVYKTTTLKGCNGITEGCSDDPKHFVEYSNKKYKSCGGGQTCSVSADGKQWQCVAQ